MFQQLFHGQVPPAFSFRPHLISGALTRHPSIAGGTTQALVIPLVSTEKHTVMSLINIITPCCHRRDFLKPAGLQSPMATPLNTGKHMTKPPETPATMIILHYSNYKQTANNGDKYCHFESKASGKCRVKWKGRIVL